MALARKKKRQTVRVGQINIPWYRTGDQRTGVDFRSIQALPEALRKIRYFTDHERAMQLAHATALELHNSGSEGMQILTASDRNDFAKLNAAAALHGTTVAEAIAEWIEVRKAAGQYILRDLVAAGRTVLSRKLRPSADVAIELLTSKLQNDLHGRYRSGLEQTYKAFCTEHPGDLSEIKVGDIEKYLAQLTVGSRRRDNILTEIRTLFRFAKMRGYLPDQVTEAAKVGKVNVLSGDISIFSVEQMRILLEHVEEESLPYLAIGGFAGIRPEEMALAKDAKKSKDPLRWEDFDWDEREICIRRQTSKVGRPRRVPISDNLWEWLTPWRNKKDLRGLITPGGKTVIAEFGKNGRLLKAVRKTLATDLGRSSFSIEWENDILRHSYGSYRMAVIKDMQQLSYEMGNSIKIIKDHYDSPRTKREGAAWFAITPQQAANVTNLPLFQHG